jgi:sec-independent protein translocase protein TatA
MGIGGIGIWQLLIILAIVIMLFGTKRLRTLGSDMGAAIKGFRSTMKPDEPDDGEPATPESKAEESAEKK